MLPNSLGVLLIHSLTRDKSARTAGAWRDSMLKGGEKVLGWAVTFLIIALIAAVFGFGGIAAASAGIAKLLFFIFLVMCVLFFIFGWRGRGVP